MKVTQEQALEALNRMRHKSKLLPLRLQPEANKDYETLRQYIEGQRWQPIETAPKDGSEFNATDGLSVFSCTWQEKYDGDDAGWCYAQYTYGGTLYEGNLTLDIAPTRWKPLPEPPQEDIT